MTRPTRKLTTSCWRKLAWEPLARFALAFPSSSKSRSRLMLRSRMRDEALESPYCHNWNEVVVDSKRGRQSGEVASSLCSGTPLDVVSASWLVPCRESCMGARRHRSYLQQEKCAFRLGGSHPLTGVPLLIECWSNVKISNWYLIISFTYRNVNEWPPKITLIFIYIK